VRQDEEGPRVMDARPIELPAPRAPQVATAVRPSWTHSAERPLRIAQVAPLHHAAPRAAAGTGRTIATLCDGLVARGHDVTLFGPGTSVTDARLEAFGTPLRDRVDADDMAHVVDHAHLEMLAALAARAGDFDVVHSHLDVPTLPMTRLIATPTVVTLHGRLDRAVVRELLPRHGSVPLVSVSKDQRRAVQDLDLAWAATVHHGLDLGRYRDVPHDVGGYLGFVGEVTAEDGPLTAIEVSRRAGVPLRWAARIDRTNIAYYDEEVGRRMGAHTRFVGEVTEADRPTFHACARATLFPSDRPEPFDVAMVESLAAGTPVIALRRGSVAEVVEHGVTGFVCDDVDDMVRAVRRLDEIDPEACRRSAERFSAERMCREYVAVYRALVQRSALDTLLGPGQRLLPGLGES
jgi:glycosyltransferase involved in cell wall biosynthesis